MGTPNMQLLPLETAAAAHPAAMNRGTLMGAPAATPDIQLSMSAMREMMREIVDQAIEPLNAEIAAINKNVKDSKA